MKLLSCATTTLFRFGEKLAKEIEPDDIFLTQHVKRTESKFKFTKISLIKVFDTLKKNLKNGKSAGLFHMPNKALKIAEDVRCNIN